MSLLPTPIVEKRHRDSPTHVGAFTLSIAWILRYVWVFLMDEIEILWWTDDRLAHTNDGSGGVGAVARQSGRRVGTQCRLFGREDNHGPGRQCGKRGKVLRCN